MKVAVFINIAIVFLLQACCTKKDCNTGLYQMELKGFSFSEVDTVVVSRYEKNSGFVHLIDSTVAWTSLNNDGSSTLYTEGQIDINKDYKIYFPGIDQSYTLTDFQMGRKACNSCAPFGRESDFYDVLEGYRINGVTHRMNTVFINK
ncbi:MAG: hypothetical protein K0R51_276 [Cytophagaceae bacterium]|jgi:hypothetical protein|nr:hypothetical protein [Cytophagaceae bacterium]